ncbi:hypothetical protein JCM1841_005330 [Sporobolomyces salmonicolor]
MAVQDDSQTLSTDYLDLTLLPYGHTFQSLVVRPHGAPASPSTREHERDAKKSDDSPSSEPGQHDVDVLVGLADSEEQHHSKARSFFGPLVGRYANRLPAGRIELNTGAILNLAGSGGVCLHGGEAGFDTLPWTPIARTDSELFGADEPEHPLPPLPSDPHAAPTEVSAMHRLYSPAGSDGFPCTVTAESLVVVSAPKEEDDAGKTGRSVGKVKIVLRAHIKEDGDADIDKGTPINLTVHWGFRLDNCKEGDALGHRLYIDSDKLVALDEKGLSTGSIDPIPRGNGLDFHSSGLEGEHRKIGDGYPEGGIDRNFLFSYSPPSPSSPGPLSPTPQIVLSSPSSGTSDDPSLSLHFRSSLPSAQIYTAPSLDGTGPARKAVHRQAPDAGSDEGKQGYDANGAIFLEFQQPVGTVMHTAVKGAEQGASELGRWLDERATKLGREERTWERDSVLRRGEVWESWVEVDVRVG